MKLALNMYLAYKLILGNGGKDVHDNCSWFTNGGIIVLCVLGAICIFSVVLFVLKKRRSGF